MTLKPQFVKNDSGPYQDSKNQNAHKRTHAEGVFRVVLL